MVVGTDNFGCSDTISVDVNVLSKPAINVTNNTSICEGESIPLIASGKQIITFGFHQVD